MKELIRTNDLILISLIKNILNNESIKFSILDIHASVIEGSINAIQKRILVSNDDFKRSQMLIQALENVNFYE